MRWPAIIFSRICSLGVTYDVFPMSEPPICADSYYDTRDPSAHTVFLLPTLAADASVVSYQSGIPSPSAALAGAVFLAFVRGLPLSDSEIESGGKIFKMHINQKTKNIKIFLPKCKLLCANREIFIDNTRIFVSEAEYEEMKIPVVKCADATSFSDENLAAIALELSDTTPIGAIAYSIFDDRAIARARFTNKHTDSPLITAMTVARCAGVGTILKSLTVECSDTEILVESVGSSFAVSSKETRYLTLGAPDIL
ncbi:MAG: hypothetical protein IJW03_02155 [Clostridia bacterium]|nr:hypothetical protein [Clostridia bacterium]